MSRGDVPRFATVPLFAALALAACLGCGGDERIDLAGAQRRAMVSTGDPSRLRTQLARAARGEAITIGAIGGSITEGARASSAEKSWLRRTAHWWRERFPGTLRVVNAGVGATGSAYGALRARRDLLAKHPDVVFVDFAVNDPSDRDAQESYEGLCRQILAEPQKPAVVLVSFMDRTERSAEDVHLPVAERYRLPMLSLRAGLRQEIRAGRLSWSEFLADDVHPTDEGHRLTGLLLTGYLADQLAVARAGESTPSVRASDDLPLPLVSDRFARTVLHEAADLEPRTAQGFVLDDERRAWVAREAGSVFEAEVSGEIPLLMDWHVRGPMGRARVMVDGVESTALLRDGWFAEPWGGWRATVRLPADPARTKHRVRVEVLPEHDPASSGFEFRVLGLGAAGVSHEEAASVPRFVDVGEAAGIARISQSYDAALADYDRDGRADVFVGAHGMPAALFHNLGDGRFRDEIAGSGLDPSGDKHGTAWGDFDGDGLPDLYVSLGAGRGKQVKQNLLYRNLGDGRFQEVAEQQGVTDPTGRARSVAWLDADLDGHLDLLVTNLETPNRLFLGRAGGRFVESAAEFGVAQPWAVRVAWGDLDGDRAPDLIFAGTPGGLRVMGNRGGRRFEEQTAEAGLTKLGRAVGGMTLGDVDADGDLDLYLAYGRDFTDSILLGADGRLRFAILARDAPSGFDFESDVAAGAAPYFEVLENGTPIAVEQVWCGGSVHPAAAGFTCAGTDVARDSMPTAAGLVVWRDPDPVPAAHGGAGSWRWHVRWTIPGDHQITGFVRGARAPSPVAMTRRVEGGGELWLGDGAGHFVRARDSGIDHRANGHLAQFGDVDNDGDLDLYVVDSGVDGAGARNRLFLGTGNGKFVAADDAAGAGPDPGDGRGSGAHLFDFDGDGRLDIFLTNGWGLPPFDHGPLRLLRNETTPERAWLAVELEGSRSNRAGLGAWIEVRACGRAQVRFHQGHANGYSQSMLPAHFGLGGCREAATVRVRWPSGIDQTISGVVTSRTVRVREERAEAKPAAAADGR